MKCLECSKEFNNERSLHLHLKIHGGQSKYYQKHFPRKDLLTNELIKFKNKNDYLDSYFNSEENMLNYLNSSPNEYCRSVIEKIIKSHCLKKSINFLPSSLYLQLAELPRLDFIIKNYENCKDFCKELDLNQIYDKRLPSTFNSDIPEDFQILIDTREQIPFKFKNSISSKLDFGDYTCSGDYYSKTFVDRKSLTDFKGTFGVGYERFKNEVRRAKSFNSFLFIVVESSIEEIKKQNESTKFKTNISYAFHNVRELLRDYPDTVQFAFCSDRNYAKKITEKILFAGSSIWQTDIQYYLDHGFI